LKILSIKNSGGIKADITDAGAAVQSLVVPDKNGKLGDVVLGFDSPEEYLNKNDPYLGVIVGRYGNRIDEGKFTLGGKSYQVTINDGTNHLHGGVNGFSKKVWNAEKINNDLGEAVKLVYQSKDMEEGYPGNLTLSVIYTLTDENELRIDYEASTDKETILNPTHHSYFNLTGNPQNTILDQVVMINADKYTPVNKNLIPTGELASVENTPFDFRKPLEVGHHIEDENEQLKFAGGYDFNWVLNDYTGSVRKAASVFDRVSGRYMEVFTDQPGIQFYSGNFLNGTVKGKGGIAYHRRCGLCFEAQHFPNSPNEQSFPSTVLKPGEVYKQTTIYKFSVHS